jgi:ribosomal protein S18 acetylase RimI-like enzyme
VDPRPIDRSTHLAWLADRLASPDARIWIGIDHDEVPVGVVRFERGPDGLAVVSITVAPEARGRGVGGVLLERGLATAAELRPAGFRARVRATNQASLALFHAAGFQDAETDGSEPEIRELLLARPGPDPA